MSSSGLSFSTLQKYRCNDHGVPTRTSMEQEECEQSCAMFFFPLNMLPVHEQAQLQAVGLVNRQFEPLLMRSKHVAFLERALEGLPAGFASLDASRPWIAYWVLHALDLLQALEDQPEQLVTRTITTLQTCWNATTGGFGGGFMQLSHTATTYASCLALAVMGTPEALASVDRQGLYRFFMSRKDPVSKAFSAHEGGEIDIRVTYCVIAIASLYGILTDELTDGVVEFAIACQTYEGGFAGEPFNEAHGGYAFCALATLWILDSIERIRDLESLIRWLVNRQMAFEGGYQGRTNKLVDGCYSLWQGALPALLEATIDKHFASDAYQCNRIQLQKYILLCGQQLDGGLRDKPGKPRDHYHTCYCLSGLSIAQHGFAANGNKGRTPVVFGDASNLVAATHPAYNIRIDKVEFAREYFATQTPFVPQN